MNKTVLLFEEFETLDITAQKRKTLFKQNKSIILESSNCKNVTNLYNHTNIQTLALTVCFL